MQPRADAHRPWSPLIVATISVIWPAGGALLTVRNLHRLREIDAARMRSLSLAVLAVCAAGMGTVLSVAQFSSARSPRIDTGTLLVLGFGIAVVSYLVQVAPFRTWRGKTEAATGSWLSAIGTALLYQIVAAVAAVLLFGLTVGVRALLVGAAP